MNTLTDLLPTPRPAPLPARAAAEGCLYELAPADAAVLPLARSWLWLGLLALVGSGLFSVLLVLSRTPGLNQWLPVADFFR
ncbi:MAG: hypothetical protein Q8L92_16715, partial [Rubrivivax sp.]|nr:hypothetical protein [Rubrivivax sp.]